MGEGPTIVLGVLAEIFTRAAYLGMLYLFVWAVWNWIVLPSMPYIVGVFS